MRVSLGEYKELKAEVVAAKREALNWQLMYQDAIAEAPLILKSVAEIERLRNENKRLKQRIACKCEIQLGEE